MESSCKILAIAIAPGLWVSLKKSLSDGHHEYVRRAVESARNARIFATYAAEPAWRRLNALGVHAAAVFSENDVLPEELECDRGMPALQQCEALITQTDVVFSYVRVDAPITGAELDAWIGRMRGLLGESAHIFVCDSSIPLDGDAIARLLDAGNGLSEADAAELRERLMGLGYL